MSDCLFCRIVEGKVDADRVAEGDDWVAFRDIAPKAPTHVLVVPREHVTTTNDLGPQHDAIVGRLVRAAARIAADEGIAESGYRVLMNCNRDGGQAVFHIHLHLLGGRRLAPLG